MFITRATIFYSLAGGSGGGSGGKVIPLPVRKKINEAGLGPEYLEQKKRYHQRVYDSFCNDIYCARSLNKLVELAARHMGDLFQPDSVLLLVPLGPVDNTYSAIKAMVDKALEEDKLIYLRDLRDGRAITVEERPGGPDLYSESVRALGAKPEELEKMDLKSLVIAPLVVYDKLDERLQLLGVLILFSRKTDLLHELAGVVPLRNYTNMLADAVSQLMGRW